MVRDALITTSITTAFTFHMHWISIIRSLYFRIFLASFLITLMSPEIATSINIYVPFSLSQIMMSSLLLEIVLLVCTCWFHNMVTLLSWLVLTDLGSLFNFIPISLHILKWRWAHALSYLLANNGHADMMCSTVSSNCLQSLRLLSVSVCNIFVTWQVLRAPRGTGSQSF